MSDSLAQKVANFQAQRILNRPSMGSLAVLPPESAEQALAWLEDFVIVNETETSRETTDKTRKYVREFTVLAKGDDFLIPGDMEGTVVIGDPAQGLIIGDIAA